MSVGRGSGDVGSECEGSSFVQGSQFPVKKPPSTTRAVSESLSTREQTGGIPWISTKDGLFDSFSTSISTGTWNIQQRLASLTLKLGLVPVVVGRMLRRWGPWGYIRQVRVSRLVTCCVHDASQTRQLLLFGLSQYNAHHRDRHPGRGCVLGRATPHQRHHTRAD